MNRARGVLLAILATGALGIAAASPASAYPPGTPLLTTPTPTTNVGSPVTLTATGFVAGAVVTFTIGGTAVGTATANASGSASLSVTAPAAGSYTVVASSADGRSASMPLVVLPAGAPIPATGSDSSRPAIIASVLVLVGAGLVGATLVRRRARAVAIG